MDKIIAVVIVAGKLFLLWAGYIVAVNVAMKTMSVLLAVGKFLKFVRIIGMMVKAKGAWAAIQWALNAAMTANPIGVIIVAIGALIGIIVLLVKHWKTVWNWISKIFDNKWVQLIGTIFAPMITIPIMIAKNWEQVKEVLATVWDAIKSGVKAAGLFLFEFLIQPFELLLRLVAKIPGKVGNLAQSALDSIGDIRVAVSSEMQQPEGKKQQAEVKKDRSEFINSDANFKQTLVDQRESNVSIDVNNYNNSDIGVQTAGMPIRWNKTSMFGF